MDPATTWYGQVSSVVIPEAGAIRSFSKERSLADSERFRFEALISGIGCNVPSIEKTRLGTPGHESPAVPCDCEFESGMRIGSRYRPGSNECTIQASTEHGESTVTCFSTLCELRRISQMYRLRYARAWFGCTSRRFLCSVVYGHDAAVLLGV